MVNTIKDLWNGNITPYTQCGENNPEIKNLLDLMDQNKDDLYQITTPQQQEIFEKYTDCSEEYLLLLLEEAFCQGFCLASRLTSEALSDNSPFGA